MQYWGYHGYGYGMGFVMVIFWVLVIIGAVYLVRYLARGSLRHEQEEAPLDIIKKRYARGEITKDEYDRMKRDLSA
jgi:putative membrane protein